MIFTFHFYKVSVLYEGGWKGGGEGWGVVVGYPDK